MLTTKKSFQANERGLGYARLPSVAIALDAVPNHRSDLFATAPLLTCLLVGMVGHCF